jgi:uncharacterized protein
MGGCSALQRGVAANLATRGMTVFTFDLRGVGRSTGKSTYTGAHEVKDVEAVCEWVHKTLDVDIILVGSSAGAYLAPDVRFTWCTWQRHSRGY